MVWFILDVEAFFVERDFFDVLLGVLLDYKFFVLEFIFSQ